VLTTNIEEDPEDEDTIDEDGESSWVKELLDELEELSLQVLVHLFYVLFQL
jgi:hypothetical protein